MLLEKFGMEIDDVAGLAGEADHVDTAGKGLQIDIGTDHFAALVHHIKGIFLAVEIETLETGTAADFKVIDTGFFGGLQRGQEVFGLNAGTNAGLETIPEGAIHKTDFFHLAILAFLYVT